MLLKKLKFTLLLVLLYQTPLYSKSTSFDNFNAKNLSNYFSGIVAFEDKNNSKALKFFNSSKILINKHDPYLKRYIYSLVLENKVPQAINIIKSTKKKSNTDFFESHLLLILDSLKKNDFKKAEKLIKEFDNLNRLDRFNGAVLESLKQYIYVFNENKILENKKNLGKLSEITDTFQRCYLGDNFTDSYFDNLINNGEEDYRRYVYFYLSYLIENNKLEEAKKITNRLNYINTPLLLSQGKSWIENNQAEKLISFFSCRNPNDIISEFLFLISNLYSSMDDFKKSNFYLNLSNFLNPKFIFNFSLVAENQFLNGEYKKSKKTLKNFKEEDYFYYWYRIKKEAQILAKEKNLKESLKYIKSKFEQFDYPNNKLIFDIANFYKNSKEYKEAIKYYTKIIDNIDDDTAIKSDLLYRRGGSYERIGEYENADKDLLHSLKLNSGDAYVLNYLAYSWLERNYKINEAIEMLETAYSIKSNDPYIIDSIGWAYYLINDFEKAEKFLKRAVELMPDDPIVNDHYGDILWKLDRKIQARYFWLNALKMKDIEEGMIEKINIKMVEGLKNS